VLLVVAPKPDDTKKCNNQRRPPKCPRNVMNAFAENIAANAKDRRPSNTASGVEDEKSPRLQPIHTGEQRSEGAKQCHETAEEHDLSTVTYEQIMSELDLTCIEADDVPPPGQRCTPKLTAHPKADIVADDGTGRCCRNDQPNMQCMLGAGLHCRSDKGRLTRQRHARTLQHDDDRDGPVSIAHEKAVKPFQVNKLQLRMLICPDASNAQNGMAAVSARWQHRLRLNAALITGKLKNGKIMLTRIFGDSPFIAMAKLLALSLLIGPALPQRIAATRMRIAFKEFYHPVVRRGLEPIAELTNISVFAAIPGALNQFSKESERAASGSIGRQVGLASTGKAPPCHADISRLGNRQSVEPTAPNVTMWTGAPQPRHAAC
jgi:hypothetical protein